MSRVVSKLLPATRSVRLLRAQGYVADMAERKIGLFSKDWGGFADIVAIRPGWSKSPDVLLVQATGWGNVRSRERKVLASPDAYDCVWSGCRVQVWGWHKEKHEPKIFDLSDIDLYAPELPGL